MGQFLPSWLDVLTIILIVAVSLNALINLLALAVIIFNALVMWFLSFWHHMFFEEMSCEQLDETNFEKRFEDFCFRLSLSINKALKELSPLVRDKILFLIRVRKWMFLKIIEDNRDKGLAKGLGVSIVVPKGAKFPLLVGLSFRLKLNDVALPINPGCDTGHYIHQDGVVN